MPSHDAEPSVDAESTSPDAGSTTTDGTPPFVVETTSTGLRVLGELDLATAPRLAEHLDPLPTWCGDVVILDVAELRFVDSTGLSALLRAHQLAQSTGRRLVLRSPSPRVRRLLEITALEEVLAVEGDDRPVQADAGSDGVTA